MVPKLKQTAYLVFAVSFIQLHRQSLQVSLQRSFGELQLCCLVLHRVQVFRHVLLLGLQLVSGFLHLAYLLVQISSFAVNCRKLSFQLSDLVVQVFNISLVSADRLFLQHQSCLSRVQSVVRSSLG